MVTAPQLLSFLVVLFVVCVALVSMICGHFAISSHREAPPGSWAWARRKKATHHIGQFSTSGNIPKVSREFAQFANLLFNVTKTKEMKQRQGASGV